LPEANKFMSYKKYQKKIISVENLVKKKLKKIVLCHGVFDLVHPGHLRHFFFAKERSKTLVVSVTSDQYINKGLYRPFVNEKLRSLNLAALEVVDFVIINDSPDPLSLLKKLKPSFFAKGFDYSSRLNKKTLAEENLVRSYGGKIIFTPGDVMFSSSKFINEKKINLDTEKLQFVLKEKKITLTELENIIEKFKTIEATVVGDIIVDQQIYCHHTMTQNKTPTLNLSYEHSKKFVGGAAIVAKHLRAAGAKVKFISFSGKDSNTNFIVRELKKDRIQNIIFKNLTRITNLKQSIYSKNYNLLKISRTNKESLTHNELENLIKELKKIKSGVLLFSDFRHGIFDSTTIPILSKNINKNIIKVADSQVASRWGNISDFKNFDLITPNENEARFSTSDQNSNISSLSRKLFKISNCKNMILKLGEHGALCVKKIKNELHESYLLPSLVSKLTDPIGSGDALLAYSSLTFAITKCHARAGLMGTIAAACKIEVQGNIPVKNLEVINKIKKLKVELNIN